jgi:TPR repeat protein
MFAACFLQIDNLRATVGFTSAMRLNSLLYLAASFYLMSFTPSNAQSSGDIAYISELNEGLIAYTMQEYELAFRLLEQLAKKNVPLAQLLVGRLFASGLGARQDCDRAVTWLTRAARNGNGDAAFELASFSEQGRCVPHNMSQALIWYEVAAANGDIEAPNVIGEIYLGRGDTAPDLPKALFWFKRGVKLYDPMTYYHLGEMYAAGQGVPKDLIEAYKWFDLAAGLFAFQLNRGTEARDKIREMLMPTQVAEGQIRASEYRIQFIHPYSQKLQTANAVTARP